jgi:hypothetical protein
MPTKRTPLNRCRTPPIPPEAVELFKKLSKVPKRRRDNPEFRERDRTLHRMLGISGDWFCDVVSVLDTERVSHRTGIHHETWLRVRAVRERLLELAGMSEKASNVRGREHMTDGGILESARSRQDDAANGLLLLVRDVPIPGGKDGR